MQDENKPIEPAATPAPPTLQDSPSPAGIPPTVPQQPMQPVTPPVSSPPAFQQPPVRKKDNSFLSFVFTLVIAFVVVQLVNSFLFQSYKVFGSSMVPTLHDGDRLIISKVGKTSARLRGQTYEPKRGDVIVFVDPQQSDLQLIKRVIGLPGERVVVKDGQLTVYNKEHPGGFNPDTSGAYHADLPTTSGENDVHVPQGHLFVSGDNRAGSNSLDSRNELGTVPEDLVIGTLKVRLWPFTDAKFF